MTVYLLVDDKPEDFSGAFRILAIYQHRVKAEKRLRQLQAKDPYAYQYCSVWPRTVITGYARPRRHQ